MSVITFLCVDMGQLKTLVRTLNVMKTGCAESFLTEILQSFCSRMTLNIRNNVVIFRFLDKNSEFNIFGYNCNSCLLCLLLKITKSW